MTITEYENSYGELMVLIVDEANDKAESMTKAEYDRQQAQQVEHLTEIVADETPTK